MNSNNKCINSDKFITFPEYGGVIPDLLSNFYNERYAGMIVRDNDVANFLENNVDIVDHEPNYLEIESHIKSTSRLLGVRLDETDEGYPNRIRCYGYNSTYNIISSVDINKLSESDLNEKWVLLEYDGSEKLKKMASAIKIDNRLPIYKFRDA